MGNGGEFELPQEVLSVLPSDPYEQLDIARRITAMAVATRMSKLEAETGKLRQKLTEKEHFIHGLQERIAESEATLRETNARIQHSMDEQTKLVNEKNGLAAQVKKLLRDVAKLETFKRTLMQSLREDDDNPNGDIGDNQGGPNPNMAIWKASQASESTVQNLEALENDSRITKACVGTTSSKEGHHGELDDATSKPLTPTPSWSTPSLSPGQDSELTPIGSPKQQREKGSPLITMNVIDTQQIPIPSSQPTSRSNTAPNSPSRQGSLPTRTTRVDGKEFFRQARSRLSYEQFSSFLANIKELNAHRQTREETLRKAEVAFGSDNKDLYIAFEGILSRHLPS